MQIISLECNCSQINLDTHNEYMSNAKKFSYTKLKSLIKKFDIDLYNILALDLFNPWEDDTKITDKHIILVHSATEYFFTYQQ